MQRRSRTSVCIDAIPFFSETLDHAVSVLMIVLVSSIPDTCMYVAVPIRICRRCPVNLRHGFFINAAPAA